MSLECRAGHATIIFSFAITTTRQRNRTYVTRKDTNMSRSRCLNGEATTNLDIMQQSTIVWPENLVTLSRNVVVCPAQLKGLAEKTQKLGKLQPKLQLEKIISNNKRMSER